MNLSEHFTLEELTASDTALRKGIKNIPDEATTKNLTHLANELEKVRAILGKPMIITSGFRCLELNRHIGSNDTSQHVLGLAADFVCPDFGSPHSICSKLEEEKAKLGFQQMIWEFKQWVHYGVAPIGATPNLQVATIDEGGFRLGLA
jgi:zinc D-Ala-D-Ala carboxypeptidase